MTRFFFLHAPSGETWEVTEPLQWCLAHADHPLLDRAKDGLREVIDKNGLIRLLTRKCKLNLIEILPERIIVHHWGQEGRGDLRPFFKEHGLALKDVPVALCQRKQEFIMVTLGNEFHYGERLARDFPAEIYLEKWLGRAVEEADDWQAAAGSWSSFIWEGVEQGRVPWAALKSAWQRDAVVCLNCDRQSILTGFGLAVRGLLCRSPRLVRICPVCRRYFEDYSIPNLAKWVVTHLDRPVLPGSELMMGRVVKREWPGTERMQ